MFVKMKRPGEQAYILSILYIISKNGHVVAGTYLEGESRMEQVIIEIMENYGYLGIMFLIALENLFPPIPSEVILTFGGFMTASTDLTITGVVIFSVIGSVAGAMILYYVGRLFDVEKIEQIVERWGHVLRLSVEDIEKAHRWFQKHGFWTVFFCRFIPLIRSLISIPAGMSRMNFPLFLILTMLGTLIWNVVLINIGAAVGDRWEYIVYYMEIYSNFVYAVLVVLLVGAIVYFFRKRIFQAK